VSFVDGVWYRTQEFLPDHVGTSRPMRGPDDPGIIAGAVMLLFLIAFLAFDAVRSRRRVRTVERAWSAYARERGFAFEGHSGFASFDARLGRPPHLRGVVNGVPIDVVASPTIRRRAHGRSNPSPRWTLVSAPIASVGAGPVLASGLDPEAAGIWAWLRQARQKLALEVWPTAGGGHHVIVGWWGLERDPQVLDAAIRLLVAVASRPPETFGKIPWHRRRPWGGDW
jgi:hypothetical protein